MAYPTEEETKIKGDFVRASIKNAFIKERIIYLEASDMPFLVNKIKQTANIKTEIRKTLLTEFGASMVPVGDGQVAIVKRPQKKS
jgi:hypothetical protein